MIPNKKTGGLEIIITIACTIALLTFIVIELICPCLIEDFPLTLSILTGLLTGLISAIALLFFQDRHYEKIINLYYSEIAGTYKRVDIGQDNTSNKDLENILQQNLELSIRLTHIKGTHNLKVAADYWKTESAKVVGTIEFNEKNGTTASGRFRYIEGKSFIGDSGIYKIYRLEEDKTKLLVLFHKLFPRKLNYNTDKNKGWEIWQKQ